MRRPNIVFLFSDQQHWQALGCMNSFFDTPTQDEIARESVHFETAICTTPQCSPSRSSLMTGLYPHKTGVIGNIGAGQGEIQEMAIPSIATWLKRQGYRTGYFGKWHLGERPEPREDWDEAVMARQWDGDSTDQAVRFLDNCPEGQPFALFVSQQNPHHVYEYRTDLMDASGRYVPLPPSWTREDFSGKPPIHKQFMTEDQGGLIWGSPRDDWEEYRLLYQEKNRQHDVEVRRLTDELKRRGLWDNTLLVLTSDHGDMDCHHKLIFKGPFMYEQMVRVPLIIKPPAEQGVLKGVRQKGQVSLIDLFPTLLDFAGAPIPEVDGRSLKPYLTGQSSFQERPFVVSQYFNKQIWNNPIRMIRTPHYKYNLYRGWGEELYDLVNDPHELNNLAANGSSGTVGRELRAELEHWMRANDDPFHSYGLTDRHGKPVSPEDVTQVGA